MTTDAPTRPIRVAHVITKMAVGGAQESAITTCTGLPPERYQQVLYSGVEVDSEGSIVEDARAAGVELRDVPSLVRAPQPWRDIRALIHLVGEFRRWKPDVVHTHSSKAGLIGRIAARAARVPVIVHSVHGWSFHDEMGARTRALVVASERLVARFTNAFVVESATDLPKGLDQRIGRRGAYTLIRNGIDLQRFREPRSSPLAEATRLSLGLRPNSWVVGSVGRLADQKDPLTMVRAFATVSAASPDAEFVWVGDGPLHTEVARAAEALGIGDRFHLVGLRRDVPAVLRCFDCFALSSLWEGLPRTVTEAMASGVPVVSTAVDGAVEVIEHGETGLLVEPGDSSALAAALLRVRSESDLSQRLSREGAERANWFSRDVMSSQLGHLYEALHNGEPPPRFGCPLKVVHVITGLGFGGAERQLQMLIMGSRGSGIEHEVISMTALGPIGHELRAAGVRVEEMRIHRRPGRGIFNLRAAIRRSDPDLVQTWLYHSDVVGGTIARSLRLPVVWNVRMTWMDPKRTKRSTMVLARVAARLSARLPAAVVFNSEVGRQSHAAHGFAAKRTHVIPNAIDRSRFRPDPAARGVLHSELNVRPETKIVGAVGRFDPQKAHDLLADAFSSVLQSNDALLVLAGPEIVPENPELVAMLRQFGIEERTVLLGPVADVPLLMAGLDVLVSSSRYGESVPNVVAEAVACGVPVVVTDVGAVSQLVSDQDVVVSPNDVDALAQGIERVLAAPVRSPGPDVAEPLASASVLVVQYEELYRSVLAGDRSKGIDGTP